MTKKETHRRTLDDGTEIRVDVDENGNVMIAIQDEWITPAALGSIVGFVEYHGQITVEYVEALKEREGGA